MRVFGSRVKGPAKRHSDLDLAVVGQGRLERSRLDRLAEAFSESDLPFRVDVLDWHEISEEFCQVIASRYEIIFPTRCAIC